MEEWEFTLEAAVGTYNIHLKCAKDPVMSISLFQPRQSPIQYIGKVSPEQRGQESPKESRSMSESYFQMARGM